MSEQSYWRTEGEDNRHNSGSNKEMFARYLVIAVYLFLFLSVGCTNASDPALSTGVPATRGQTAVSVEAEP
jgi:hypothetical protein